MTLYRTIVVDPPWPISVMPAWFREEHRSLRERTLGHNPRPYPVMEIDAITALPVRDMSNNIDMDAHLYLWTIDQYLEAAFGVARAWGFHHSATLVWCKPPRPGGLGGIFPSNCEYVLFCRRPKLTTRLDAAEVTCWLRGQAEAAGVSEEAINQHMGTRRMAMWWVSRNPRMAAVPSVGQWERLRALIGFGPEMDARVRELNELKGTGERAKLARADSRWFQWPRDFHSRKPDAFLDLVEQVSPGPYLEMFARRQRLGWDTWGNEALEHVLL